MKRFTENINEKAKKYAGNQKLYEEIYDLIDKTLQPMINGKKSDKISLVGKEKLVEELVIYIQKEINKSKISILEKFKNDPIIFEKNKQMLQDYKKVMNTIESVENETQLDAAEKMIDNFNKKWNKIFNDEDFEMKMDKLTKTLKDKKTKVTK